MAKAKAKKKVDAKAESKKHSVFCFPGKNDLIPDLKGIKLVGYKQNKLDLSILPVDGLIQNLFADVAKQGLKKGCMLSVKPVYGFAFGVTSDRQTSYKAVIVHHKNDGNKALVFNQNALFSQVKAFDTLEKHNVSCLKVRSFVRVNLAESNYNNVLQACRELIGSTIG